MVIANLLLWMMSRVFIFIFSVIGIWNGY